MSEPSLFEQLARRFDTYADDEIAIASRTKRTGTDARTSVVRAKTWREAAKELREIAANRKYRDSVIEDLGKLGVERRISVLEYIMGDDS